MDVNTETAMLAALGSIALAVALWIVTNVHVLRTGRAIKADIDSKRTETEAFVHKEVDRIESAVGGFEARMRAEMPPNVDGRLDEVVARFDTLVLDLKSRFDEVHTLVDELPNRVKLDFQRPAALEMKQLEKMAEEAGTSVEAVARSIPTEGMDPQSMLIKALARPTPKAWAAKNPLAATLVDLGKVKAAELFGFGGGNALGNGSSVTYTVSRKGKELM